MASGTSSSASAVAVSPLTEEELTLTVKWSGKEYTVRVCGDDTVGELKRRICEATNVLPKRQKLLYPKVGSKLADDSLLLSQIPLKAAVKMTMIGISLRYFVLPTVEDDIIVDPVESPEIVDDFELGQDEVVDIKDKDVNKQKLRRRIEQYKIELRNPCREGKKLLVLDIDYTLFDHRSPAENPLELMRPSLLDHLAMITVQSDTRGVFDCKPLGLIWAHFPEYYSAKNTIMFDDLRRNFVMNPRNGLTIKPFRKAHANRDSDQELVKLTQYLLAIAELDDLSALDHRNWESFNEDGFKRRRHA
ncbi:Ubiquitin-like domain-containing CTD phosphatase [Sesamum angolense]|uniref:Ubiquitin-like domain-containing CTD phosphatase n=1 Tax=Sesamum angolense TaxID=2727404 RepID=A0AAE1WYH9_9LAMI|nr:Ubiquitin-like domain-containing CTD phosphatase [Sesamum angolense]